MTSNNEHLANVWAHRIVMDERRAIVDRYLAFKFGPNAVRLWLQIGVAERALERLERADPELCSQ